MSEIKYTEEGQEVVVVRQVEGGYLVNHVYDYRDFGSDDDYYEADDRLVFYEKIFEKAPTHRLSEEITALEQQKESLEATITQLKEAAWSEKQLAGKASKYPILKMLYDYLTENWTHRVDLGQLEVSTKASIFNSRKITISNLRNEWSIRLHNGDYNSDSDRHIVIFQSEQDATEFAKTHAEKRIRAAAEGNYPSSQAVQNAWQNLCYDLRQDKYLREVLEEVKGKMIEKENEQKRIKAEEELKAAQEKLAKLANP